MVRLDQSADVVETATLESSPFGALLQQASQASVMPLPGQVIIGTLESAPEQGRPGSARVDGLGHVQVVHSLVPLTAQHEGQGIALSVLAGGSAIVLGTLWNGAASEPAQADPLKAAAEQDEDADGLVITVDGHREVLEAAEELELRCGEACIVLTADGRIQLRGTYITSHASATQRIVGGSVHVN